MGWIAKLLITALAAFLAAYFLPGVHMADGWTVLWVALVLALLNTFVKPILVLLTIPVTVLTLGLFLLVINAFIVKLADYLINPGFAVNGWLTALLFSIIVSIVRWLMETLLVRKRD